MKIWNTKYCLTVGITVHEIDCLPDSDLLMVEDGLGLRGITSLYKEGKTWHRTEEAAVDRAEELKIAKLQSLDKEVKKISALVFSVGVK